MVTDAVAPFHQGGKELRYHELGHRLAGQAQVDVYTMNWWQDGPVRRDGEVTYHAICGFHPLYHGSRRSIRQALVFALACLRLLWVEADVFEADHMPYLQLFPLRLVATLKRRRLVVTWHEVWGPAYWRSYLGRAGAIGWWCERMAMRLPHLIIAASEPTAERLRTLTGGRARIVVAPNGIDRELIADTEPAPDPADIVVVGRLLPHKRVDLLLHALSILAAEDLRPTACVIGQGPEFMPLRGLAKRLRVYRQVTFLPDVADAGRLYSLIKAARVAVFPSEREGFGIAVLEALACGVPVITTSAPHNLAQDLVARSPGGGIVCEPTPEALAAALRTALLSADPAAPLDQDWIEDYDWTSIAQAVYAVLS